MSSFAYEVSAASDEDWMNMLARTPWLYWPGRIRRQWMVERSAAKRELLEFAKYINELESK